jgi:hypothetical protein
VTWSLSSDIDKGDEMKIAAAFVFQLVLLMSINAFAVSDPFFDRLQGDWTGQGSAFGRPAQIKTNFEWVLEKKFTRLSLSYTTKVADGSERIFSGHAYYNAKGDGKYEGYWFDSQGNQYPIQAKLEGDTLTALWGIPGKSEGKSVYRLSEGSFFVNDYVKQPNGEWREFSKFELKKK